MPIRLIRQARWAVIECFIGDRLIGDSLLLVMHALPEKNCPNVGCDGSHIADDCNLKPLCASCGMYGHFPHECGSQCTHCGRKGHAMSRCNTPKHKDGRWIERLVPAPLIRPANEPRIELIPQVWAYINERRAQIGIGPCLLQDEGR